MEYIQTAPEIKNTILSDQYHQLDWERIKAIPIYIQPTTYELPNI